MPAAEPIAADAGRVVLGIGGLAVRRARAGSLVTHALGSCLGIAVHDPASGVGGMLHAQLPLGALNPDRARECPSLFVDLGIDLLFAAACELGAARGALRITVAGGANVTGPAGGLFDIAARNLTVMRRSLWRLGVLVAAEEVGGGIPRTMTLDLGTGATAIESLGRRTVL